MRIFSIFLYIKAYILNIIYGLFSLVKWKESDSFKYGGTRGGINTKKKKKKRSYLNWNDGKEQKDILWL